MMDPLEQRVRFDPYTKNLHLKRLARLAAKGLRLLDVCIAATLAELSWLGAEQAAARVMAELEA